MGRDQHQWLVPRKTETFLKTALLLHVGGHRRRQERRKAIIARSSGRDETIGWHRLSCVIRNKVRFRGAEAAIEAAQLTAEISQEGPFSVACDEIRCVIGRRPLPGKEAAR